MPLFRLLQEIYFQGDGIHLLKGETGKRDWPTILGDFEYGFGIDHGIVFTNPHISTVEPTRHNELSPGYSVARFIRDSRDIEL